MLGKWDREGLDVPRERWFCWLILDYGQEDERAECEHCGATMSKSVYGYRHSLPLVCPNCRTKMRGFSTERRTEKRHEKPFELPVLRERGCGDNKPS